MINAGMERWLKNSIDGSERRLAAFAARLKDDPLSALEDADKAMEAAARRSVALSVRNRLDEGQALADVVTQIHKTLLTGALYPRRSCSPSDCLMSQYRVAANAEAYEYLGAVLAEQKGGE